MKKIITMRHFLLLCLCFLCLNCGSSFKGFYNTHKNDVGVTAFQVPNFMKAVLSKISPETQTLFNNISDLKYITFNAVSQTKRQALVNEMNAVTQNGYTDMFRKNEKNNTRVISVIEEGNIVTNAIIFNSSTNETSAFYLQGRFDPDKIRSFSNPNTFNKFKNEFLNSYQGQFNPGFNPNPY